MVKKLKAECSCGATGFKSKGQWVSHFKFEYRGQRKDFLALTEGGTPEHRYISLLRGAKPRIDDSGAITKAPVYNEFEGLDRCMCYILFTGEFDNQFCQDHNYLRGQDPRMGMVPHSSVCTCTPCLDSIRFDKKEWLKV